MKVLDGTKQAWIARGGLGALLLGSFVMGFAIFRMDDLGDAAFSLWILGGLAVGLFGFVWLSVRVRCPACGTKLFWYGLTKISGGAGIHWFMQLRECPECGYSGPAAEDE